MCLAFLYYYNKVPGFEICNSRVDSPEFRQYFLGAENVTWDQTRLEFVVDPPHKLAGLTISQVSDNHVKWTLERRRELQRFARYIPQKSQCSRIEYGNVASEAANRLTVSSVYPHEIRPWARTPPCTRN